LNEKTATSERWGWPFHDGDEERGDWSP